MAYETSVTDSALRVAHSLHDFARDRGWVPEEYRVFMTVNTDWNLARASIVSDRFAGLSEENQLELYDDIMDKLEFDLSDDPDLYRSLGLTLLPTSDYGFLANSPLKSGEVEIPDAMLNPDVTDWRAPFHGKPL